jgi:hypothetical protein
MVSGRHAEKRAREKKGFGFLSDLISSLLLSLKMERETGIEPATSSLGIWSWIVNKEHMRPRWQILNIKSHGISAFFAFALLNAVIAVTRRLPL